MLRYVAGGWNTRGSEMIMHEKAAETAIFSGNEASARLQALTQGNGHYCYTNASFNVLCCPRCLLLAQKTTRPDMKAEAQDSLHRKLHTWKKSSKKVMDEWGKKDHLKKKRRQPSSF